jgi:amino acid adenylation domain-containing protein
VNNRRPAEPSDGLASGFFRSAARCPTRLALVVGDARWTYQRLRGQALRIASTIIKHEAHPDPLVAIFAARSTAAYSGILGILAAGKGYVPLNPKFPIERSRTMLRLSGCSVVIVGPETLEQLPGLLRDWPQPLTVILPESDDSAELSAACPGHRFVMAAEMADDGDVVEPGPRDPDATAYLLFTSGSTGQPKGVPVRHASVRAYLDYICARYGVTEEDRVSQEFDLTFDLSVHDMFVGWERGACLFSVPERAVMLPAKFIRENALTMWFSVPSVAGALAKTGLLVPGSFPSLRWSLFCGEPLSAAYAGQWQEAAPHSIVENLYGPTEATIAISHYRWAPATSPRECVNGIVPIGWMFEGQHGRVVDERQQLTADDQPGELHLAGSQLTSGYWNNPEKTQAQFVRLPGTVQPVWYRTGDVVKRGPNGCLYYLGRTDHQVKIRGYRVELQEIEAVLRRICGTEQAIAVPWQVIDGSADGVVAFVSGVTALDERAVLSAAREVLPDYMLPRQIRLLPEMPLNANGKIDRAKLLRMLEGA